jgi:hypothetical protein
VTVFTYGHVIGGRAYFVTSDFFNQRVRDNEIEVAPGRPIRPSTDK